MNKDNKDGAYSQWQEAQHPRHPAGNSQGGEFAEKGGASAPASRWRTRADGTVTTTTPEWDEKWYWPVGTRVKVGAQSGVIVKANNVSASVKLEDGRVVDRVSLKALQRIR
jgi:hypothetical protein